MDAVNRFESRTTYRLLRAEYGIALVVSGALFLEHLGEIRWLPALVLFTYIDLIGYLPGAVAFHRAKGRPIPRFYYVLYNTMHSFVSQAVVAALWVVLIGPEWALLVLPIHLCGDRAIFGNFLKPFSVPFEPTPIPAFDEFTRALPHQPAGASKRPATLAASSLGET